MKKLFIILLGICLLEACITETEEPQSFSVSYRNEASAVCTIRGFNGRNTPFFEYTLHQYEESSQCEYISEAFIGDYCLDSITIIFPNCKGYACDVRNNGVMREFCFSDGRNPLVGIPEDFSRLENNHYQFTITQENFLNAKDLD